MDKPTRVNGRDPLLEKAKDAANQRKIASNNSDKASRRNAPLIKARANRTVRRADKAVLLHVDEGLDESADAIRLQHRIKPKLWGTDNAAERRTARLAERKLLDETAGQQPQGRRRAALIARAQLTTKEES